MALKHHWDIHCHDDATEPYCSITEKPAVEIAFELDTYTVCLFLSEDNVLRTECRKVQIGNFVLVGLKPARASNEDT